MAHLAARRLLKHTLQAAHFMGAARLFGGRFAGIGAIFMLHRVNPDPDPARPTDFAPHRHLSISPEFLAQVIAHVRALDIDIVSLGEATQRIAAGNTARRFVAFTLDDGYRDNLDHAYPVFLDSRTPFTIFVTSSWPEGRGVIWWLLLEHIIGAAGELDCSAVGLPRCLAAGTATQKWRAFGLIVQRLEQMDEDAKLAAVRQMAEQHGIDADAICRSVMMSWDEIRQLAQDDLVTIGAHSIVHPILARLSETRMRDELVQGRDAVEQMLNRPCRHLAYPYGYGNTAGPREFAVARSLGFASAVLGRGGPVTAQHRDCLTALPRIPLEGDMQDQRCLDMLMSGLPFAVRDLTRRLPRLLRPAAVAPGLPM